MIEEVRESVVSALQEMNYDTSEVTGETVLGPAGLDLESLAVAELAVRIEDTFGVRFDNDEVTDLVDATLDQFVEAVNVRIKPAMVAGESE